MWDFIGDAGSRVFILLVCVTIAWVFRVMFLDSAASEEELNVWRVAFVVVSLFVVLDTFRPPSDRSFFPESHQSYSEESEYRGYRRGEG